MIPHFQIPLDLPHAGRISYRIYRLLRARSEEEPEHGRAALLAWQLIELLLPYVQSEMNPPPPEANLAREEAARLGRLLVEVIEEYSLQEDRLGQCVRNLFECLEMGEEGALISLRAGENPDSLQRPI
jgi:hypothetical protein